MKEIFICTSILTIISFILVIRDLSGFSKIYDISLAIFGSALLTAISSLIGYFVERKRCLEEYYECLEKIVHKLNQYSECNEENIDSDIPYNNINMLKSVLFDDFQELGNRYANISFLFDPRKRYRTFIYSSYDYIQDIKRATLRRIEIITLLVLRNNNHGNKKFKASLFVLLNHIFISKTTKSISFGNSTVKINTVSNRITTDMNLYLDKYLNLMNRNIIAILKGFFLTDIYFFNNSIFDNTTFKVLDNHYQHLVKNITLAVDEQDTWNVKYSAITKEEVEYLMSHHYISGYSQRKDQNGKLSLEVTDKLYYYSHFLLKYQKSQNCVSVK